MARQYNNPIGGVPSNIGEFQMNEFFYQKKALVEAKRTQMFLPMASRVGMPKHMGKEIKRYHYIPLLDDENINSQGIDPNGVTSVNGNLYGSSKDIGFIPTKYPALGEAGGRVNRVGFRRKEIQGTMEKFGFFDEYTQESMDFDSDSELMMHVNREMINGASELTEDMLQVDLINNAGVIRYTGAATSIATIDAATPVTYRDLLRLHLDLSNNRTPLHTKMFKGTRLIDTVTIPSGRGMYIGHELQPTLEEMVDLHGNPAFIPSHLYAAGGPMMPGEIGRVGYFRILVNPEMLNWTGAGADATDPDFYATGGNYDVFPMLVIGDESFTTIGFQTDSNKGKFTIYHKKPGKEIADRSNPYGEIGFMSIKWWYGFMLLRGERLAVVYSAAKL